MTWLGVFAVTAVPLSCLELKEQVYVQVCAEGCSNTPGA